MTKETNISIKTWSAIAMLASGVLMAYIALFLPPVGEISEDVLWYCGQCFIYAGTIFQLRGWKQEIDNKLQNVKKGEKKTE